MGLGGNVLKAKAKAEAGKSGQRSVSSGQI